MCSIMYGVWNTRVTLGWGPWVSGTGPLGWGEAEEKVREKHILGKYIMLCIVEYCSVAAVA